MLIIRTTKEARKMSHSRTRWFLALVALFGLVLVGTLGIPQVARAVEFDDDGIVAADEVIDDDLFISGETVVVDGTINGNLIVSGADVTINGNVNGDLLMSGVAMTVNGQVNGNLAFIGQSLSLDGGVRGSLFCIGSSVTLEPSAIVGRNVFFNGFGLEMEPGSTVGRDVLASGYQALLAGRVERDVHAEVGALEIEGFVGRDVTATVSKPGEGLPRGLWWPGMPPMVDAGLRVAEDAYVGGTLTYVSPIKQADAIEATPGGGVVYEAPDEPEVRVGFAHRAGQWFLARVRDFVTLLVLGSLVVWKRQALLDRLTDQARSQPLPALGWGFAIMIGGHVAIVVLAVLVLVLGILMSVVTLGGLALTVFGVGFSGLALVFALFSLSVAYGSKLIVAYLVGKLILQRLAFAHADKAIWSLVLGIVLYILVRAVPGLGWLIGAIMTLAGLGAMWLLFRQQRRAPEPT
jgi:cytoskeletal protein CcmA (bactofilin family)